jgi:protein involved in polysaccharide export with SLBB domain
MEYLQVDFGESLLGNAVRSLTLMEKPSLFSFVHVTNSRSKCGWCPEPAWIRYGKIVQHLICVLALFLCLATAAVAQGSPASTGGGGQYVPSMVQDPDGGYKLGSGDKLRIIVFGEEGLGGEFQVDGSGFVQLPLLGQIQAAGLTSRQFESKVKAAFDAGYLRDARVNVEIANYRPFYIIGEVSKPGGYPYVSGMNLINAIALAGGYTYRANERRIYIRRNGAPSEQEFPAEASTQVNPGDVIRVPERFF